MFRFMIANFALLTAFLFLFNLLFRHYLKKPSRPLQFKLLIGVLHGLCALLLLLFSYKVSPNIMIDFRHIIVICSAYFGGLPASLMTVLFIVIARTTLFGEFTLTTIAACITIITAGIGSGLIMQYIDQYWRRWLLSLLLSLTLISIASLLMGPSLDKVSYTALFTYMALIGSGGLFSARLIAFFTYSNQLGQELENSERRYRSLHMLQEAIFQSSAGTVITVFNIEGKITHINKAVETVLGYSPDTLIGRETPLLFHDKEEISVYAGELSSLTHKPYNGLDVFKYCAMEQPPEGREWSYIHKDGSRLTVLLVVTPLWLDGEITGFIGTATDITERKKMENTLQQLSLMDGLTNIANRRYFDETLEKEWKRAQRSGSPEGLSLIMFDIDYFKAYNDLYGHQAGDECLRKIALLGKDAVRRPSDLIARYGGEEFAVILPDTNRTGALALAEKLRAAVENEKLSHAGSRISGMVTISIGVSHCLPHTGASAEQLIAEADQALYYSKAAGRNRVNDYRAILEQAAD
ncbi:sensor domain-containing diguanylate cyclase [Paenibacillus camerounensis]|uniref:sensor domain-containing diguanylate cyclase n=1 Tax=Paenibacillus camerounensis TaxID=1243663 RepID=UPI0005A9C508|nr:diguanylate cyclase [Paenibacillus camerounensis]